MRQVVIALGATTGAATLVTLGLVLFDRFVAAAIVGTATAFLWLALLVVGTVAVTSWWSASLMERGAKLALQSQESDDRRDIAMMGAVTQVARMVSTLRSGQQPALPLPGQQNGEWLPPLAEFIAEFPIESEVEHGP